MSIRKSATPHNHPVCLITGASRGIGLATAQRFAKRGFAIVAVARSAAALGEAADQIRSHGVEVETLACDVADGAAARGAIDSAVRRFGRLDVLINNAGAAPLSPIEQMSDADYRLALGINVDAVFHLTRAAWPVMRAQGGGTIVNVSSVASTDPFPGFAVYGACKAWVNLFTRACAAEGRALGIRVHSIAPGAVETDMLRQHFPTFPAAQALSPDEVAAAIEAACDERLANATGETIFVRK